MIRKAMIKGLVDEIGNSSSGPKGHQMRLGPSWRGIFKNWLNRAKCIRLMHSSDSVEEFDDDFEMYFKTPQQLVELFNDLEERNLFLISTTQDAEQNLEELKTQHHKTKLVTISWNLRSKRPSLRICEGKRSN
jgi:hypothetical protein